VGKSAYIHTAGYFFDCLWLVDRQSLREPDELFTGNIPDLLFIARPGEFPVFKTFIQQQKAVALLSEYSDKKIYPQVFVIRTFLWNKA